VVESRNEYKKKESVASLTDSPQAAKSWALTYADISNKETPQAKGYFPG
jgi:hypothetical protein